MKTTAATANRRILIVDDNPAIHEDFKKILCSHAEPTALAAAKSAIFGTPSPAATRCNFELSHATQGQSALECVRQANAAGQPFALAFIDVRMPPGWDGIETAAEIWKIDPLLQVVICTAYSDYSWDQMGALLGEPDNLLILKKPFDNIEVLQLAHALTTKWNLTRDVSSRIEHLDHAVAERTAALQQSEERFVQAFRNNPLPVFIERLEDHKILHVNAAFLSYIGVEANEAIGRRPDELLLWVPGPEGPSANVLDGCSNDAGVSLVLRRGAGDERQVLVFAERYKVAGENCRFVLLQDVTERIRSETDLRHAQKMEAIGQLAAGVAHDFNNVLTVIQGHISLVLAEERLAPSATEGLDAALAASQRAANLTRQLLAFSRKQVMERKPVHLVSVFAQLKTMLGRLIGDQVTISVGPLDAVLPVYADPGNLEQVLVNLAVNARDAMPRGGTLSMTAEMAHIPPPQHLAPALEAGVAGFVCISISDTGCGMDEATKARIFDPFFTTKDVGKGTGMGLATVHGIIKQHQGWIEVDSMPGRGTTFRVYLPATRETAEESARTPCSLPVPSKTLQTILVVEDEPSVMELVVRVLDGVGYEVLSARSAAEALVVWAENRSKISLLFTDLVMPGGTSGNELAALLRKENAMLPVIFSTGYSAKLVAGDYRAPGISLLQKPYSAEKLAATIRARLEASPAPRAPIYTS